MALYYHWCIYFRVASESIRDKPPGKPPFTPEGERAQIKIAPHGQTMCARAAHLLAESGNFYFIRRRSLGVATLARKIVHPGKIPVFYGQMPVLPLLAFGARVVLDTALEGGLG
jgi:hypothetical protein